MLNLDTHVLVHALLGGLTASERRLLALGRIHVWPLDLAICRQTLRLGFESDPADEIIAATSIVHKVALVARDRRIRRSRLVPLAG